MIDFSRNHFQLFDLPQRYRIDGAALDAAYRALQATVHPDRHAQADDAQRRVAMQASARVNEAYATLKDPVLRAQYLLRLHGVEAVGETDTALPFDFLEAQLERREAAEDARRAGDDRTLAALLADVRAAARDLEARLGSELDDARAFAHARTHARQLTFLAKLAQDLDEILAALDER
ncbi:MAG: Fe-S protein assembly co-chaperone HscB [Burkholderiales bacterium]